jgi:hypothetical protein
VSGAACPEQVEQDWYDFNASCDPMTSGSCADCADAYDWFTKKYTELNCVTSDGVKLSPASALDVGSFSGCDFF